MRRLASLLALAVLSSPALADPTCASGPKEKWLSEDAMKQKIVALGYKYDVFKVTKGNCFEIYGRDKAGARVEIYFNPLTGEVVNEFKN